MINRKGVKNRRSSKPDKVIGGKQGTKWTSVRQSRLRDQFFRTDQHNGPVVTVEPARYAGTDSAATAPPIDDQSDRDSHRRHH
jgi:hypothetical protein